MLHNEVFISVKRLFHAGIINGTIKPSEALMLNHSEHAKSHLHALY